MCILAGPTIDPLFADAGDALALRRAIYDHLRQRPLPIDPDTVTEIPEATLDTLIQEATRHFLGDGDANIDTLEAANAIFTVPNAKTMWEDPSLREAAANEYIDLIAAELKKGAGAPGATPFLLSVELRHALFKLITGKNTMGRMIKKEGSNHKLQTAAEVLGAQAVCCPGGHQKGSFHWRTHRREIYTQALKQSPIYVGLEGDLFPAEIQALIASFAEAGSFAIQESKDGFEDQGEVVCRDPDRHVTEFSELRTVEGNIVASVTLGEPMPVPTSCASPVRVRPDDQNTNPTHLILSHFGSIKKKARPEKTAEFCAWNKDLGTSPFLLFLERASDIEMGRDTAFAMDCNFMFVDENGGLVSGFQEALNAMGLVAIMPGQLVKESRAKIQDQLHRCTSKEPGEYPESMIILERYDPRNDAKYEALAQDNGWGLKQHIIFPKIAGRPKKENIIHDPKTLPVVDSFGPGCIGDHAAVQSAYITLGNAADGHGIVKSYKAFLPSKDSPPPLDPNSYAYKLNHLAQLCFYDAVRRAIIQFSQNCEETLAQIESKKEK